MLARARDTAAGHEGLSFLQADAQSHGFEPGSFDAAVSRFGVMFFSSPEDAFTNLRHALASGGRLAFVCWQALGRNAWMSAPLAAVARHLGTLASAPAPEPGAPGPFAFADAGRVNGILAAAGFDAVRIDPLEGALSLGGAATAEEAARFVVEVGPAGTALREAGADAALRARVVAEAARALDPFVGDHGVEVPYAAWLATARAPG